jgi:hypothetical protein
LTGPRTAGQSVGVMAAVCDHQVLSARTHKTNETRGLDNRQEVTVGDRLQALIQCRCAFNHKNALSGQNLSDVLMLDGNSAGIARDTGGALGDVRDRARFCRTTVTRIWSVSDPSD